MHDAQAVGPARRHQAGVLVVGQLAALGVLHALPAPRVELIDPIGWVDHVGLEVALAASCRAVAVAMAWWLLAATVLALVAARWQGGRADAVARRVVPARLRALVDRAVATGVLAATVVGPTTFGLAPAAASEPVALVSIDGDGTLLPPGLRPPMPAPAPSPSATGPQPAPPPPLGPAGEDAADIARSSDRAPVAEHVVRPGEHLWAIAARRVAAATARAEASLGDHEIARYWARLVAANRARVRSGDPDVIHPGERIQLPAFEPTEVAP